MERKRSQESGQAIVLLVISIVVLLGFTALAIDGGMLYSDRRQAKNAADTAALAGAGEVASKLQIAQLAYQNWDCPDVLDAVSGSATTAAIYRADTNGYEIDGTFEDGNGVLITCRDELGYPVSRRYVDIRTGITASTSTSFAHLLYSSPLQNYVESAVRVEVPPPFGAGFALLALNESACQGGQNGMIYSGRADVTIEDGSAYTNCCLYGNGNRFAVTTTLGGTVGYYDECTAMGTLTNITSVTTGDEIVEEEGPEYPTCSGSGSVTTQVIDGENWRVFSPGSYTSISNPNGNMRMLPGLYCLTGSPSAFSITGGKVEAIGVTLAVDRGRVSVAGNAEVVMTAPCIAEGRNGETYDTNAYQCYDDVYSYPDPAIPYFLIYMAHGNTSTIELEGNGDSVFAGAIFSPDGTVVLRGTSDTQTFETQIVAKNIEVTGSGIVNIYFNDDNLFQYGSRLSNLQ
jgi:Flp pilus assembly protein TadG